jgi:hypothetical protein
MAYDSQINFCSETKESLLFAPVSKSAPRVVLPSIVTSAPQGLDPAHIQTIVDTTVMQLGDTIQAAVRDAVLALKNNADVADVTGVPARATAPVVKDPVGPVEIDSSPMITDDDGFRRVSSRFTFNNAYATVDHPYLRRTSYTIFKLVDRDSNIRDAKLYHVGQILLFCSASARIVDNNFRIVTMPADYLAFADAFNQNARKQFATYNPRSGAPIIPIDPITAADFKLDQDLIRSLERTFPRADFSFRSDANTGGKEIASKVSAPAKIRKRADTPYPRSAIRNRAVTGGPSRKANN